jgi:hypothetical protein
MEMPTMVLSLRRRHQHYMPRESAYLKHDPQEYGSTTQMFREPSLALVLVTATKGALAVGTTRIG